MTLSPAASSLFSTLRLCPSQRSFSSSSLLAKRQFARPQYLAMDLSALESRLATLSLAPATAPATPLQTFFFTPKSGSKHPVNTADDLKLVIVAIEETKNVGAAKALAASVGLKDMRALSVADLTNLIGRAKEAGP